MTAIEKELLEEIEQEKKAENKPSDIESELRSEIQTEPKKEEPEKEPKTTPTEVAGAVTRGASKPLTQAIYGGTIGGALFPYAAPVSIPLGAGASVVASQVSEAFGGPDVPTALGQLTTTLVNKFAGTHYSAPEDATTELLDRLGVENPRSKAGEIIQEVSKGVAEIGTSAGALKVGGELLQAGKPAKLLQFLGQKPAQQAIVGGVSMGASEVAKQEGATPLEQAGVGLLTGAAVGGVTSALEPGAKAALQSLRGVDVPVVEKSLNVLKNLFAPQKRIIPPTITETTAKALQGSRKAEKALAEAAAGEAEIGGVRVGEAAKKLGIERGEVPQEILSGSPEFQALIKEGAATGESLLAKRQNEFLTRVADKSREILQKAGSSEDLGALSDDIKDTILKESQKYQADENALFSQLSQKPIVRTIHKPTNTLQEVETALIDAGIPQSTLDKIKLGQKLSPQELNEFNPKFASLSPITKNIFKTIYEDQKPTINTINQARKKLGDWLAGEKGEFSNATRGEVKKFYGLLSDDYDAALSAFPELEGVRQQAFALTKARKAHEENVVNLFGKELSDSLVPKVSRAIGAAAKGDSDKIKNILSAVPEDQRAEVIATGIQNIVSKEGKFDAQKFTQWYNSLKGSKNEPSAAYNALFDQLPPEAKSNFDNLNVLNQSIEKATKQTEKVGDINEQIKMNQKIGSTLWSIMKGLTAGYAANALGKQLGLDPQFVIAMSTAIGGGVLYQSAKKGQRQALLSLDEMLASGDFAKLVAKSKGNADMFNRSIPQFMREPVYVKFAKEVGPEAAKNLFYTSGRYLQESQETSKKEKLALQGMYRPAE
jgi:hypothetical protein